MNFLLRKATPEDVPQLRELIEASVRGLQAGDYSPAQIAGALQSVYGVDTQLIADGTYFAVVRAEVPVGVREEVLEDVRAVVREEVRVGVRVEDDEPAAPPLLFPQHSSLVTAPVACGGWSKRKTLYGGDQYTQREDLLLDPARDARGGAKARAFFVHPQYAADRAAARFILRTGIR